MNECGSGEEIVDIPTVCNTKLIVDEFFRQSLYQNDFLEILKNIMPTKRFLVARFWRNRWIYLTLHVVGRSKHRKNSFFFGIIHYPVVSYNWRENRFTGVLIDGFVRLQIRSEVLKMKNPNFFQACVTAGPRKLMFVGAIFDETFNDILKIISSSSSVCEEHFNAFFKNISSSCL